VVLAGSAAGLYSGARELSNPLPAHWQPHLQPRGGYPRVHGLPEPTHALHAAEAARTLAPSALRHADAGQWQAALAGTACRRSAPPEAAQAGEGMLLESVKRKRSRKMNKHKYRKRLKKMRMGKLR